MAPMPTPQWPKNCAARAVVQSSVAACGERTDVLIAPMRHVRSFSRDELVQVQYITGDEHRPGRGFAPRSRSRGPVAREAAAASGRPAKLPRWASR